MAAARAHDPLLRSTSPWALNPSRRGVTGWVMDPEPEPLSGEAKHMPPLPVTRAQYLRFVAQAYVDGERNRKAFRHVERFSLFIGYRA